LEEQFRDINYKLIESCSKGDKKAQFELYKRYAGAMYNTCYRMLKNSVEAEDVMQEGFLKAFQHIGTYSGNVSFGSWLKKIIINCSLDVLRKNKIEFENIDDIKKLEAEENDFAEESIVAHQVEEVKLAIARLPEGYRIVLSLYLLEGYDHDEIAEITGISASTSRSQLVRAKKKLLELLNERVKRIE
jgi:RNA polymerase sigma factor (sigma-70 family)